MSDTAKQRIDELVQVLRKANYEYYVKSNSLMKDYDFDMLLKELQQLEEQFPEYASENSPTKRVGGDITKKFNTIVHDIPMLSLANTYSKEELEEWEVRNRKLTEHEIEYVCELKYDGVAIGIQYRDGKLFRAVTRGDGKQGEEVTANVRTIRSIPLTLEGNFPKQLEIRGEIYFPLEAFEQLNADRVEAGFDAFMNPRNTASGTLKMQDSSIVAQRGLDCMLYGVYQKDHQFKTHFESVQAAGTWSLKTPNAFPRYIETCKSIEGIMDFVNYWDEERKNLPFEIDGIVVKVNNYTTQEELGYTAKAPRWAISYKFKAEAACTQLERVSYQVGRTGAITPVANLTPVLLAGTTVKRASLHNADQIEKLDLHEKDFVYVEKGGEIIPKITGVDLNQRKADAEPIKYIEECPECGTLLERQDGEAQHYCPNTQGCGPQVKGRIEHFISRKAMNIDGLGAETVDLLVNEGMIRTNSDLYGLQYDQLIELDRFADKSVQNLLQGVQDSKAIPFEKVLFAIGIRFVGETVAKKLAKHYQAIDKLQNATLEELVEVDEIGDKIAASVFEFFRDEENREEVKRLQEIGLNLSMSAEELAGTTDKLAGLGIVISGVFQLHSRDELKKMIEDNGGKNVSSLSKKTSYLLRGDNMGPSKLSKAEKLGIPMISEEEFLKMIG